MLDAKIERERVSDVYGRIAPIYDLWAWLTERRARARCLELAAIRDGEDVLEVAVGTGLAFVKILEANPSGHNEGIDLTSAMLMRAEKRVARTGHQAGWLPIGVAIAGSGTVRFPGSDKRVHQSIHISIGSRFRGGNMNAGPILGYSSLQSWLSALPTASTTC